jgi:hypothetical protein
MTNEEITRYIQEKWSNYSRGLAMSFAFRKDKNFTMEDVKDAFSSGAWELIQLLHRNNINIDDLKYE